MQLSYNGKAYHGWQIQPNAISIQEVVEHALSKLLNESISITGAGRTDAGVHAIQMFAHFDATSLNDLESLSHRLNSFLPKDIAIHDLFAVTPDAHARFDATSRTYEYHVSLTKTAFDFDRSYVLQRPLNTTLMNEGCAILMSYRNFKCFSKAHTDVKTYNCKISNALWTQNGSKLVFEITADRFLRNMVRAVVGTMINLGLGKISLDDLHTIIKSEDRSRAGYSVPAHGLYLTNISYSDKINLNT